MLAFSRLLLRAHHDAALAPGACAKPLRSLRENEDDWDDDWDADGDEEDEDEIEPGEGESWPDFDGFDDSGFDEEPEPAPDDFYLDDEDDDIDDWD